MENLTEYNSRISLESFHGERMRAILKTKLFAVLVFAFIASLAVSSPIIRNMFGSAQINKLLAGNGLFNIFSEKADSFIIEEYVNGSWQFVAESQFPGRPYPDRYTTKTFTLPQPSDRIRITHNGNTQTAHLDEVVLGGNAPDSVQDLYDNNPLPIEKFGSADYDVTEVYNRTLEFSWNEKGSSLTITGVAENFKGMPYRWPKSGYLTYKIGDKETYTFAEVPVSSHPSAERYAYFSADKNNLYVKIDWTSDNTLDIDKNGDWAELGVQTKNGIKTFLLKGNETEWGKSAFEYTDKVSWQHKVYSFSIPLSQISVNYNESIQFRIRYYGTDGGGDGGGDGGDGGDGGGDGGNAGASEDSGAGGDAPIPACVAVEVPQTPVACSSYAGINLGAGVTRIPADYIVGSASWTLNSCTSAITYTGGCTPPPPACVATEIVQPVVSCAAYAGVAGSGIPAGYTVGNASWTTNSCTNAITYTGGCTPPPSLCTLTASPATIGTGGSSILSWTTRNAASISIDNGIGTIVLVNGTRFVSPETTTTYTSTITGTGGDTVLCTATITVSSSTPTMTPILTPTQTPTSTPTSTSTSTPTPTAPVCALTAAPTSVATGASSVLSWTTSNATTFSIDTGIGNMVPVPSGSTTTPAINADTTFTGTATSTGGSVTCMATVTVTPVVVPPPSPGGGCTSNCGGGGGPIISVPGGGGGVYLARQKLSPYTGITLASYVYLSQLPYTGINNLDIILFFTILILISGVGSYQLTRSNR